MGNYGLVFGFQGSRDYTGGTVTSFAFTNGSGFIGTVTNASTTPTLALTVSTTENYVLKTGASGALANSIFRDDGTGIGLNSAPETGTARMVIGAGNQPIGLKITNITNGNYAYTALWNTTGNQFAIYADTELYLGLTTATNLYLITGGSPRLKITNSTGNVGIGTGATDASYRLTVQTSDANYGIVHTNGTIQIGTYIGAGFGQFGTATSHRMLLITNGGSGAFQIGLTGNIQVAGDGSSVPAAKIHIMAGTASANTQPILLTSGTSLTTPIAGSIEFTTDDLFFTITTGDARKRLLMADPVGGLTSTRIPYATTNGRLTDTSNLNWTNANMCLGIGGTNTTTGVDITAVADTVSQVAIRTSGTTGQSQNFLVNSTNSAYAQTTAYGSAVSGTIMGANKTGMVSLELSPATGGVGVVGTVSNFALVLGTNNIERARFLNTGCLVFTAGAAGAGTAPLKFTSGTNNTTAEAGAMEYNGTNLFFTRSGTTRQTVLTANVVTTEVVVSDTTVTVNVAGTDYKLLARA